MPFSKNTNLTDQSYLASLGAFITIAALAVDPFSQQVLQYYDCLQVVPRSIASIPKTNRYSVTGMHTGALSASLDGPAQVAIYMGLLNPPSNSSSSISVDCPTGNCTFPADAGATFSTLGMCHSCTDISDTVSANTTTIPRNYTLESGAWVGREVLTSTVLADYDDSLFAFEALMLNYPERCMDGAELKSSASDCTPEDPFAVRCTLDPCVQTYAANVTESVYSETLLSSENLPYVMDNGFYWILATNRTLDNGTWRSCNASTTPTPSNTVGIGANGTIPTGTKQAAEAQLYYPDSCVWVFNFTSAISHREFLSNTLTDTELSYYAIPTAIVGELWLQNLYRNGSANASTVDDFMQGLTMSMTANMRSRGDTPSSGWATGTPLASKTCIRVRWAWFALPAALWVLAVGFVAMLLAQSTFGAGSRRAWWQQRTWKSSVLVPLFLGFDASTREKLRDAGSPAVSGQEMQDAARSMRVQLCDQGSGLEFMDTSAREKEGAEMPGSEAVSEGDGAQRSSLLEPEHVAGASRSSRPQSPVSWRSVSPPA